MQILQIKIRGTTNIQDSGWVTLSQGLTIIQGNDDQQRKEFLTSLETINPLFDSHSTVPFHDFPTFSLVHGHKKRIQPHKKTVAYSIYATSPNLTRELSEIDPIFYETDRIEVGRKLDYSHWVSFVEMSASTKWKEFEEVAQPLFQSLPSSSINALSHIVNTYKTNDRIIDTFSHELTLWMNEIALILPSDQQPLYQQCLFLIGRAERFNMARRYFESNLPLYIFVDETPQLQSSYSLMEVNKKEPNSPLHLLLYKCSNILKTTIDVSVINDSITTIRQQLIEKIGGVIKIPELFFTKSHLEISLSDSTIDTVSDYLITLILLSKILFKPFPLLLLHDIEKKVSKSKQQNLFEQLTHISNVCQILLSTNADIGRLEQRSRTLQFDQNSSGGKIIDITPK